MKAAMLIEYGLHIFREFKNSSECYRNENDAIINTSLEKSPDFFPQEYLPMSVVLLPVVAFRSRTDGNGLRHDSVMCKATT